MTIYAEVIGDPISHSKSPLIHGFWLEKLGMVAEYRRQQVSAETLAGYFAQRRDDSEWRGCNVTLPHKQAVLGLVGDPGGVGASIGAANTIMREPDGTLIATNTDAAGFYVPLAAREWAGASALVIGAGGASRAILFALAQADVAEVVLLARSPLKAAALLSHFGLKGRVLAMDAAIPPVDLLVNCSPLGMIGQDALEIDISPLGADAIVYDIVYAPIETQLLKQARAMRLETIDGLDMLIGQAGLAFELFFGSPPPENCEDELRELLLK